MLHNSSTKLQAAQLFVAEMEEKDKHTKPGVDVCGFHDGKHFIRRLLSVPAMKQYRMLHAALCSFEGTILTVLKKAGQHDLLKEHQLRVFLVHSLPTCDSYSHLNMDHSLDHGVALLRTLYGEEEVILAANPALARCIKVCGDIPDARMVIESICKEYMPDMKQHDISVHVQKGDGKSGILGDGTSFGILYAELIFTRKPGGSGLETNYPFHSAPKPSSSSATPPPGFKLGGGITGLARGCTFGNSGSLFSTTPAEAIADQQFGYKK